MSDYVSQARRRWPEAVWIIGNGAYASVAYCGDTSVMLFSTQAEAMTAKEFIDRTACGHACHRRHEIVHLATTRRAANPPEGAP